MSNGDIRGVLEATARDAGPVGRDVHYGAGILDVPEAVKAAALLVAKK
jgi:hypothetical protein